MGLRERGRPTITPAIDRNERPRARPKMQEYDPPPLDGPKQGDLIYVWSDKVRPTGADSVRIIVAMVTKVLQQGRVAANGIAGDTIMRVFDDCAPEHDESDRSRNAPFHWAPTPYMEMRIWYEEKAAAIDALLVSFQEPKAESSGATL